MSEENVEIVRRMMDAWSRRDLEAAIEMLHPEIEWRLTLTPGGPEGTAYRGVDGIRDWFGEVDEVWTGLRIDAVEFRDVGGDRVIQLGRFRAVAKESGVPIDQPQGTLLELKNGRVFRVRGFGSHREALEAAGLSE